MDPLRRYKAILMGTEVPAFRQAMATPVGFSGEDDDEKLWNAHESALRERAEGATYVVDGASLLDLKLELVNRMLRECRLCERRCGADRIAGERGECGVGEARIASMFLHHGEEAPLVPSFTVFFAGCNFKCVFCQNYDISTDPNCGREVPPDSLARRIENLTDVGRAGFHVSLVREWGEKAKNVNWVGGEPTPNLRYVLEVLKECRANIPQIWNSNMYMSEPTMRLLQGAVDLYLADFKYGNDECAMRLSGAKDYTRIVERNHKLAATHGEVIVRHLMLPGHLECCTIPVLDWLAENTPSVLVNVMDQYHPAHRANEFPELRVGVKAKDYEMALDHAHSLGLRLI